MEKISILLLFLFGFSVSGFTQETYKIGNTEYYYSRTYSTTGKPMVKRSFANKTKFLRSKGYTSTPFGYQIDHIIPLSQGGTDSPSNMQLLTIEQHARKTERERSYSSNSTYKTYPTYKSNSTSTYKYPKAYSTPSSSTNERIIYTGKNGGKYYINNNGNKTYIRSKSQSNSFNNIYSTPTYKSNKTIYTGSRGGKYYINSSGKKTYIK